MSKFEIPQSYIIVIINDNEFGLEELKPAFPMRKIDEIE